MSRVLVGRRDELCQLTAALDVVAGGRTSVTLVAGEAGVGKTRLIGEFATRAAERGVRVVSGRCIDLGESSTPLAPFAEIVDQLVEELDRETLTVVMGRSADVIAAFVPALEDGSTLLQPRPREPLSSDRFCELAVGIVRRLAAQGPVVLVIEDLHWADTSTRMLFAALSRVPRLGPLALVGTFRSDELHRRHPLLRLLADIERHVDGQRIDLSPFDLAATAELVAAIDDTADDVIIDEIQHRSGGNPFFTEELLAARRSGITSTPDTLRETILARATELGDEETEVLGVIAVAGRASADVLHDVCGLPHSGIRAASGVLVVSGLLVVDGDELRFRHELGREVFSGELLPGQRALIHGGLAASLEHRHPNRLGEIARHWLGAHDPRRALGPSVRAGRHALRHGAAAEAEEHFSMALELWDAVADAEGACGVDYPALVCEAAVAAEHAGHQDRAIELALHAVDELAGHVTRQGAVWLELRRIYRFKNCWDECAKAAAMALALIPPSPPSRERAEALAASAMSALYADETSRARDAAQAAVMVAVAVGEPNAMVDAHYALTMTMSSLGERDRALAEALANVSRCGPDVSVHRTLMAYNGVTNCLTDLARYDEVVDFAERGTRIARDTGLAGVQGAWMAAYWIGGLVMLGRWAEAERLVGELADLLDNPDEDVVLARYWGCALIRQGRLDEARPYIARIRTTLEHGVWLEEPHSLAAAVVEFDHADGRRDATEGVDALLNRQSQRQGTVELVLAAITASADDFQNVGGSPRQRRHDVVTASALRWIEHIDAPLDGGWRPGPETELSMEAVSAQMTRLQGRAQPERWAQLAAKSQRLELRYEEATARFHQGEASLAGVAGRSVAARRGAEDALTTARALAADLTAVPLVRRIDDLAHRARLHLHPPQSPCRPQVPQPCRPPDDLTRREHEVLALLARGRSNGAIGRELFISTKTASVHVSSILRKLGVSNRVEAAAIAVHRSLGNEI